MLIDWFTVLAQAVNFLILVWLLQRFLYKPVLAAIAVRETKIAAELADAAAKKKEAEAERDDFRTKSNAFEHERSELLRKATDEARVERQRLLDTARQDSETLSLTLNEAVTNERDKLNREIMMRTQEEVFAVARKVLADLAGASLEERITEVFIRRLSAMPAEQKALLGALLRKNAAAAIVRSAFELPPASRATLETVVRENLGADRKIDFQILPGLVCGIELSVDGQKISWSVADYLALLAADVTTLLKQQPDATLPTATVTQHAA